MGVRRYADAVLVIWIDGAIFTDEQDSLELVGERFIRE